MTYLWFTGYTWTDSLTLMMGKDAEVFECTCKQRALYSLPVYLYLLSLITVNFYSPWTLNAEPTRLAPQPTTVLQSAARVQHSPFSHWHLLIYQLL